MQVRAEYIIKTRVFNQYRRTIDAQGQSLLNDMTTKDPPVQGKKAPGSQGKKAGWTFQ